MTPLAQTQPVPRTIGPFRIEGVLGRGGGGVVYRGTHRDSGQPAAVKTVLLTRRELLSTLRREIHSLARLRHPGIVRVWDHGIEDGVPWYAMELLAGRSLRHHLAAQAGEAPEAGLLPWWTRSLQGLAELSENWSPSAAVWPDPARSGDPRPGPAQGGHRRLDAEALAGILTLVRRLCDPLAFLHGEGLVHRDLKPENVLLREDGTPVLVDFGLSSHFGRDGARESLEVGGLILGTAAYMAPEQARAELVDARADLYALGCLLYELLSGTPPFGNGPAAEVMRQHLTALPVSLADQVEGIPAELDELVARLLAKRPHQRWGHAMDVARILDGLGARPGSGPDPPVPRSYLYRPRFVGRAEALDVLVPALDTVEEGTGRLLWLRGESGVGKTRLLTELASEATARGLQVLAGEALPLAPSAKERGSTAAGSLQLFRPAMQAIADLCRTSGPQVTASLLGQQARTLASYVPGLADVFDLAAAEPETRPASPQEARCVLYEALDATLKALARVHPLLLVLDDLQWADELSLGFLRFLLQQHPGGVLEGQPLLIVGAFRPEEAGAVLRGLWEAPTETRLSLGRFSEEAVGAMVCDMLALSRQPEVFVRFLTQRSEGNPFHVAAYLRTAVTEGLLFRDAAGRWQVQDAGPAETSEARYERLPLPHALRDLVQRHLASLARPQRELVEMAAVLGRECDEALLARLVPQTESEGQEAIRELVARQLWEATPAGLLRFAHDRIREVAYEGLRSQRRRALHRAAATALEQLPAGQTGPRLAGLGLHWERAGRHAKARTAYLAAARQARMEYAHGEAERLYAAYLALIRGPTRQSIAVRNELAKDVHFMCSRALEAIAQHRIALEEARKLRDRTGEAASLYGLGIALWTLGRSAEALELLQQAVALQCKRKDRRAQGMSLHGISTILRSQGRLEEARRIGEEALSMHRGSGNLQFEGMTISTLAGMEWEQGRTSEARALYQQALRIHTALRDPRNEGVVLGNLASLHVHLGQFELAASLYQQALERHRRVGNQRSAATVLLNMGNLRQAQGQLAEALPLLLQALESLTKMGESYYRAHTLLALAASERKIGRTFDTAQQYLEEAESEFQHSNNAALLARCLCERGHLLLARGQDARACLEQARALAPHDQSRELLLARQALHNAIEAFQAGQPLHHGECTTDVFRTG